MQDAKALTLISRRYADRFGATPTLDYPHIAHQPRADGEIGAALGYRWADNGPLFLETYLDAPIEALLSHHLARTVERGRIVEIGNLAADVAPAMIRLWAQAANDLGDLAEIAVAVLSAELRAMFGRLGVTLHMLARADAGRLGEAAEQWGSYYRGDPWICAGFIAEGQGRLARFSTAVQGQTA